MGKLIAPYMVFSAEDGLITQQGDVVLLLAFSEPVQGLDAGGIAVSPGATVAGLKKIRGTETYYQMFVSLPPTYYGTVQVAITVREHDAYALTTLTSATVDGDGCGGEACAAHRALELHAGVAAPGAEHLVQVAVAKVCTSHFVTMTHKQSHKKVAHYCALAARALLCR